MQQFLVDYKNNLRTFQFSLKSKIKNLKEEIREIERKGFDKYLLLEEIWRESKYPELTKELAIFFKTFNNIDPKNMDFARFVDDLDVELFCENSVETAMTNYNIFQKIINAISNDEIINYIELEKLLISFVLARVDFNTAYKILGMTVNYNAGYKKKLSEKLQDDQIKSRMLMDYFAKDGNFIPNFDVEGLENLLNEIMETELINYQLVCDKTRVIPTEVTNEIIETWENLVSDFSKKLRATNLSHLNNVKREKDLNEMPKVVKKEVSFELENELKNYYKNGKLIKLPDDINEFEILLDKCNVDTKEKRYIIGLVQERLKKLSKNIVIKYLHVEDIPAYENAMELVNKLPKSDANYYILVGLLDELKTTGEMLEVASNEEDKEYLYNEINTLMVNTKEIVEKYNNKECENNVVFLGDANGVTYVELDTNHLDKSCNKKIFSGLKKLKKENQPNFKVLTSKTKLQYPIYYISLARLCIFFIEIDEGIYLTLGSAAVGENYNNIINRLISNMDEVKNIEKLIKDDKTRDRYLRNNEEYLNLFNLENDVQRTRKKDN